jgi:transposase
MTKKGAIAARTAAVKRRTFTREFKLKVIREIEAGKSQAQVAREYQITETTISKWRRQHRQYQDRAFAGRGHAYTDEARLHELERMVGRLTMENDFLKKALAETGKRELKTERRRRQLFMELLRQHREERPTAERSPTKLGEAVGLSRATIWRQLRQPSTSNEDELELRSQIQTIALEMRAYGYRPITAELHQRGVKVNHKHRVAAAARRQSALSAPARLRAYH